MLGITSKQTSRILLLLLASYLLTLKTAVKMPPNSPINLSISLLLIIQMFLIRRNRITTEIRLRRLRRAALAALARHRQILSEKMKMMPRLCIYIYKNVHIHLFHTVFEYPDGESTVYLQSH